jgi:hypothetical protein
MFLLLQVRTQGEEMDTSPYMSSSLIKIYHSPFHSVLTYGIVFWGTLPSIDKLFKLEKRVIHIISQGVRTSCRDLFKEMKILPLKSQYIFSTLLFVVKNKKLVISNYNSHNVRTRQCEYLHHPTAVLIKKVYILWA